MDTIDIYIFRSMIFEIYGSATEDFGGMGLIYCQNYDELPVSPLRASVPTGMTLPIKQKAAIIKAILVLNTKDSFYHDGFHILSQKGLTHICQYFSPPLQNVTNLDYTKGGRYRAAHYGSCLPSVIATGVIGEDYGPCIFTQGEITYL